MSAVPYKSSEGTRRVREGEVDRVTAVEGNTERTFLLKLWRLLLDADGVLGQRQRGLEKFVSGLCSEMEQTSFRSDQISPLKPIRKCQNLRSYGTIVKS